MLLTSVIRTFNSSVNTSGTVQLKVAEVCSSAKVTQVVPSRVYSTFQGPTDPRADQLITSEVHRTQLLPSGDSTKTPKGFIVKTSSEISLELELEESEILSKP